jgi:hypothetical protein
MTLTQNIFKPMVDAVAAAYVRDRHLAGPMRMSGAALWPRELADYSIEGTGRLITRIQNTVKAVEFCAGHWSYDMNRHVALLGALQAEKAFLASLHQQRVVSLYEAAE